MKIGILTIVDYDNYGNRLQNYALQEVLKKLGHDVITVKNFHETKKPFLKRIFKLFIPSKVLNKIQENIVNKARYHEIDAERVNSFKKFTDKYIDENEIPIYDVSDDFSELEDCDCFVIGSDQVWNYNFPRFSFIDFAGFTNKPKFSYAASFGVNEIPNNLKKMYEKGLKQLESISVREDVGKKIVEELTNRKSTVVLDPTLLLDREQWLTLIKGRTIYSEKYVVTYFLSKPNKKVVKYINTYAYKNNLEIKNLATRKDVKLWVANPADFVNLLYQAENVFTDSFHACVFSIIFKKNFEVFERNGTNGSMNSRIETLLNKFNLDSRWHHNGNTPNDSIDYSLINSLLCKERKSSIDFLEDSLNIVENKKI